MNGGERLLVHRFGQKIDSACLHRLRAHRHIAMAGDENNLLFAVGERLLELETVEAWQLHVENETRWSVVGRPIEIGLRRGKRLRGQASGTKQT